MSDMTYRLGSKRGLLVIVLSQVFCFSSSDGGTPTAELELSKTTITGGENFVVTLLAPHLNLRSDEKDSVTAFMVSTKTNEPEHEILMVETESSSGHFIGEVATFLSAAAALAEPQIINVLPGTVITVFLPGDGGIPQVERSITVLYAGEFILPHSVVAGDQLQIHLFDPDSNLDDSRDDVVEVSVSISCIPAETNFVCPSPLDARPEQGVENLTLRETSPRSSLFTGTLDTFVQVGALGLHDSENDGAVDIRGPSESCSTDNVVLTYLDRTPAQTVQAVVETTFRGEISLSTVVVPALGNSTLLVSVVDADLLNRTSVEVTFKTSKEDEPTKTASLQLSACHPAPTFMSNFTLNSRQFHIADEVMGVRPSDLLTISYHDEGTNEILKSFVRFSTNGSIIATPAMFGRSFLDTDTELATVSLGESFEVAVEDLDLDTNPTTFDTVTVSVSSSQSSFQLTLRETDASSGVFTASVCTSAHVSGSCMPVLEGDLINATYADVADTGDRFSRVAHIRVATPGQISIAAQSSSGFEAGQSLTIEVFDPDLNQINHRVEQVSVLLRARDTEDTELVVLSETSASSAFFTGTMNTTENTLSHEGELLVEIGTPAGGTVVEASYSDVAPSNGKLANLKVCSPGSVTAGPTFFVAGENISITVTDADLQQDTLAQDFLNVSISSGNDTERVQLAETELWSSVFTADIQTKLGAQLQGDGLLQVLGVNEVVLVMYSDACPLATRLPSAAPRSSSAATLSAVPQLVRAGTSINITLTQPSLNQNSSKAEIWEDLVTVSAGGMERRVTLTETRNSSGTFTGSLATSSSASASQLQLSEVFGDDSSPITVSYGDDSQPGGAKRVILETHRTGVPSILQSGVDSGSVDIGANVVVKVVDKDLDYATGSKSCNVTLINTQGDQEELVLEEHGESTGIYTGAIRTRAAVGAAGDGVVNSLATGDIITMQYLDDDGSIRSAQVQCGYAGLVTVSSVITGFSTSVSVTVIDPDLNQDAAAVEEFATYSSEAVLNLKRGINNYPVRLLETAIDSSTFTGVINFYQDSVPSSQLPTCEVVVNFTCSIPRLEPTAEPEDAATVLRWDRAELSYSDPEIVGGAKVKGETSNRVTKYLSPGQNGAVTAPLTVVAGSELSITVTDQDESANEDAVESVRVKVVSSRTNERDQWVVCRETDLESRTFTGVLRTREDESENEEEAGVMHVSVEDSLEVIYRDNAAYEAINHNQTWTSSVVVAGLFVCRLGGQAGSICSGTKDSVSCGLGFCATSIPTLSIENFVIGSCIGATLTDSDKSADLSLVETVTITAANIGLADEEVIILSETDSNSVVFTGCIPSAESSLGEIGVQHDGVLLVSAGDDISVYYTDNLPVVSISRTLVAIASRVGTISVSPPSVQVGSNVTVTVSDSDLDRDSARIDTAVARVLTSRDQEEVLLTETGVASAVFTGLLETRADRVLRNGTLDGSFEGDAIVAQYVDELPDNGALRTAATVFGRVGLLSLSDIRSDGWGRVTLVDQQPLVSASVNVTLFSATASGAVIDTQNVVLHVDELESNEFHGRYLVTTSDASDPEYPTLTTTPAGSVITALYYDLSPPVQITAEREVLSSDPGTLYTNPLQLLSGTRFSMTIVDQDLNLDSSRIDYAEVRVSSSDPVQQAEVVTLTESSPASGTFTGELETTQGTSGQAENDGRIDANPGDELLVAYFEQAPKGTLQSVVNVQESVAGKLSVRPLVVGEHGMLFITVQDSDEDTDHQVTETIRVMLEVETGATSTVEAASLRLQETATNSGTFTGSVPAAYPVGSTVAVTYEDAAPQATTLTTAAVSVSAIGVVELGPASSEEAYDLRQGIQLRKASAGDTLTVTVLDQDLNADAQRAERTFATVLATSTSQSVLVTLEETAHDSGVFTGSFATRLRTNDPSETGIDATAIRDAMDVSYGDQLTAVYHDAAPFAQRRSNHFVRIWMPGSIVLLPSFALPGSTFSITVFDGDRDRNGTLREELTVSIVSSRIVGNALDVTLLETSPLSGAFTGELGSQEWVSTGRSDSIKLNLLPGDTLNAVYFDSFPADWLSSASATVQSTSCDCASLLVSPGHISAGEQVSIRVTDPDAASQGSEALTVEVENVDRPGQVHTLLELVRDSTDSFVGHITAVNTAIEKVSFLGPDDTVNVLPGERLQVTYRSVESTGTTEKNANVFVEIVGTLTLLPTILLAGQSLLVTVDDLDLDRTAQRESTSVVISSSNPLEPHKRLILLETGASTGRFTGELFTLDSAELGNIASENTMNVQSGHLLSVAYADELPRVQSIELTIAIAEVGRVSVQPVPLRQNGVLRVTVFDIDANLDAASIDTISVNASAPRASQVFTLFETATNSAQYTASLSISSSIAGDGDTTVLHPVMSSESVTVTYEDSFPRSTVQHSAEVLASALATVRADTELPEGGRLQITVIDPDFDGSANDFVTVSATRFPGNVMSSVTLRRATPNSAQFEGYLETISTGDDEAANGLAVSAGDVVQLQYSDPSPLTVLVATSHVQHSVKGLIDVDAERIEAGGSIYIQVEDSDLDESQSQLDFATVTAESSLAPSAESFRYDLTETGLSTGVFTALIQAEIWKPCSEFGLNCQSELETVGVADSIYVLEGETLTFSYLDSAPFNLSTITIPVCTTASMTVHTLLISIGQQISVEVHDIDKAGSDNVSILVFANGTDQDGQSFTLHEQSPGQFVATLETTSASSTTQDVLVLSDNSKVFFVYEDECPSVDTVVPANAFTLSTLTFSLLQAKIGELVAVTVEDRQQKGQRSVDVSCFGSEGDQQSLLLTQDPADSGFFVGFISPGNPGNISALSGSSIRCEYIPALPPTYVQQTLDIVASDPGLVSIEPADFSIGAEITIMLSDSDLNLDPSSLETLASAITLTSSVDEKTISLEETAVNSGVFTTVLIVSEDLSQTGMDSILVVVPGQSVQIDYLDQAPFALLSSVVLARPSTTGKININPSTIGVGGKPRILVADADLNQEPGVSETTTVIVSVTSPGAVDGIRDFAGNTYPMTTTILLTEVGTDTEYFTGSLTTVAVDDAQPLAPGSVNTVNVMAGYTVRMVYSDIAPNGHREYVTIVQPSTLASLSLSTNPARMDQALTITVHDPDVEYDPGQSIEPVVAYTVGSRGCGEGSSNACVSTGTLQIVPTTIENAVFTASVVLFDGPTEGVLGPCFLTCTDVRGSPGDFVSFYYEEVSPEASHTIQARIASNGILVLDPVGTEGVISVTVIDSDLDTNGTMHDESAVLVSVFPAGSETEVPIVETTADSGVFTGLIVSTATATGMSMIPNVAAGSNVTVRYFDSDPAAVLRSSWYIVVPSTLGVVAFEASKEQVSHIVIGGNHISISVQDSDLRYRAEFPDSTSVVARSSRQSQGSELIALIEQGADSGVFTGRLRLTVGSFNGNADDGAIDVLEGDFITFEYWDRYPNAIVKTVAKVASVGTLEMSPEPVSSGSNILFTVTDADLNVNELLVDTGEVTVENGDSSDMEVVTVTELGTNSSVFIGMLPTTSDTASFTGILTGVSERSIIKATYADVIPNFAAGQCSRCVVQTPVSMVGNITTEPTLLPVGGTIIVSLMDQDLNQDPLAQDTVTVTARQFFRAPFDEFELQMVEIGYDSGLFFGQISTSPTFGEADLYGPEGGRIIVQYDDVHPIPRTKRNSTVTISMIGAVQLNPSPLNPDATILVTVFDDDMDITNQPDATSQGLTTVSHPDDAINPNGVSLLLLETGASTGVFTGEIRTQTAVSNVAGTLIGSATSGTYVSVSYSDANPTGSRVQRVRIASAAVLVVSPAVLDEGVAIELTVTDADMNDDPSEIERCTVLLAQASDTPFSQNITLYESGIDSDVFTARVPASGSGAGNTFLAPAGSLVTAKYVDRNPTPTTTLLVQRKVSIFGELRVTQSDPTPVDNPCLIRPGLTTCTDFTYNDFSITVIDSDLETTETPSVTIYNKKGFEAEVVIMTYTGSDSTYTGTLSVLEDAAEGDSNTLSLNIDQGDVIQVVYTDDAPPVNNIYEYQVPMAGTATFEGSDVLVGSDAHPVEVYLLDSDIAGSGSVDVTVYSDSGDSETVTLVETSEPGKFAAQIRTVNNRDGIAVGDGVIQIGNLNSLDVAYLDSIPPSTRGTQWSFDRIEFRGHISTSDEIVLPDHILTITVVDCDLPLNPTTPLQTYVTFAIPGGDSVVLGLTEQENDCGTYTGSIHTSTREAADPVVLGGAVPGTVVTATYLDCSDNTPQIQTFKIASAGILTFGSSQSERIVGLPISITLADPDLDVDSTPDDIDVFVSTETDSERVTLREVSETSGVFTGTLSTSRVKGLDADGTLNECLPGERASVIYRDQEPSDNLTASMRFISESGSLSLSANSSNLVSGDSIMITVIDANLNQNPFRSESYHSRQRLVVLTSEQDVESITLRETAQNTAEFTAKLETGSERGNSEDGILHVVTKGGLGSLVEATYSDPDGSNTSLPLLCSSFGTAVSCNIARLRGTTPGSMQLSVTGYATIGESLEITVVDDDRDINLALADTLETSVSILTGGGSIAIELVETGANTGAFTASVLVTDSGTLSSTLLPVSNTNTLRFLYLDAAPSSHTVQIDVVARHAGDLSDTFNVLLPGGALRIVLSDMDLNTGPFAFDTYSGVIVRSADSLEVETVTLTETNTNSGIFTGLLKTADDQFRGIDFSGSMNVQAGDLLIVQYDDAGPERTAQRSVRVATKATLDHSPLHLYVDNPLIISVEDLDEDRNPGAPDTIQNLVSVHMDTVYKDISMTETGFSTGIFTGQVMLSSEVSTSSTFGPLASGDMVTITYRDEFPLDEFQKHLPIFQKGSIVLSPSPAMDVTSQNLGITVADADLNVDALSIEVITKESKLLYVTTGTGLSWVDFEFIEAVETGVNTGIFTAALDVSDALSATSNSGVLSPVLAGSIITGHYQDLAPTTLLRAYSSPGTAGSLNVNPTQVGAGVTLTLTVSDEDVNFDSTIAEAVQVSVTTDRTREGQEIIALRERGVDSGVFTGSLETVRSAAFGSSNDGEINVVTGTCYSDTSCSTCAVGGCTGYIVVSYMDASPPAEILAYSPVAYVGTVESCNNADSVTDYCLFRQDSLFITVTDPDLNTDPNSQDVGEVYVKAEFYSHSAGELVQTSGLPISVQETGPDTNVFVSAAVATATSNLAGQLQIYDSSTITRASTIVTAQYLNAKSGNPFVLTRLQTPATLDLKSAAGTTTFPIGEPLYITVVDGDMDISRIAPDTVHVEVTATAGPTATEDQQTILLTETGNQTAVFTAILDSTVGFPSCDDTLLSVVSDSASLVTARYVDVGLSDKAPQNALTISWPGSISFVQNFSVINQTLTITVVDRDLVGGSTPTVQFESTLASGIVPIGTAVTASTDTFSGTLELSQDIYGDPTGVERNTLTAKYYDSSHALWRTATIEIQPRGVIELSPFLQAISSLTVTVLDSSADGTDDIDSVSVVVSTEVGGSGSTVYLETETLRLTETQAQSGSFTGTIAMSRASGPDPNNGILQGDLGALSIANGLTQPVLTVTYQDQIPEKTVTATQSIACQGAFVGPLTFEIGAVVPVRISDCDLAAQASNTLIIAIQYANQTTQITLYREAANETEYSASFAGNFTTDGQPNCSATVCNVFSTATSGSEIVLVYEDSNPALNVSTRLTANVPGTISVSQTFNGQVSTNEYYKIGENSVISVADRDANIDHMQPDTVRVVVSISSELVKSSHNGTNATLGNGTNAMIGNTTINCTFSSDCPIVYDTESIMLTETGNNTNTFTGWLVTDRLAQTIVGDGRISPVASKTKLDVTYFDLAPRLNITATVSGTDFQIITLSRPISPLTGAQITARVQDSDLNMNSSAVESHVGVLTFSVCSFGGLRWCDNNSLVGAETCESVSVNLVEEDASSSDFFGAVTISPCVPSVRSPGILILFCEGRAECNVTVTYTDSQWGSFSTTGPVQRNGHLAVTSTLGVQENTFVVGERLSLTLQDGDVNQNNSLVENAALVLNVSGRYYHALTLVETGPATAIFTGSVRTFEAMAVASSDAIPILESDIVTATYLDSSPIGYVATAEIWAISRATVEISPIVITEENHDPRANREISITVVDQGISIGQTGVNVSVFAIGQLTTRIQDEETILLSQTSITGVFTGAVRTNYSLNASDPRRYEAVSSQLFYQNSSIYKYSVTYAQLGTNGDGGTRNPVAFRKHAVDGELTVSHTIRAGQILEITVTDNDRDLDWDFVDAVQVLVSSSKLHESAELVTLHETTTTSDFASFTGQLITVPSEAAGGANDGCMNVLPQDLLLVQYVEAASRDGSSRTLSATVNVTLGGDQGRVWLIDPQNGNTRSMLVNEDAIMFILITDSDPEEWIRLGSVSISSPTQTLELSMTNASSLGAGEYLLEVLTSTNPAETRPRVLGGCVRGSQITIHYHDSLPFFTITAEAVVNRGAVLTAAPQPVGMGQSVTVTVVDVDLNADTGRADVGTVSVISDRVTLGTENLAIIETGQSTSVFTATLKTALRPSIDAIDNEAINVQRGDRLTVTYVEQALGSYIVDATKEKSLEIKVGEIGTLSALVVLTPGLNMTITVVDSDLELTPETKRQAQATVTTSKDGETETVILTQTGQNSNEFTGAVRTCTRCLTEPCPDICTTPPCGCLVEPCTEGIINCPSELEGPSEDGVLYVEQGDLITVEYHDEMPETTLLAYSHVERTGSLEVIPPQYLVAGDTLNVVILDNDNNNNPNVAETVLVFIATSRNNEPSKVITLLEDGENSGRFVGGLPTIENDPLNPTNALGSDPFMVVEPGNLLLLDYDAGSWSDSTSVTVASAGAIRACVVNSRLVCESEPSIDGEYEVTLATVGDTITINVTDVDLPLDVVVEVTAHADPSDVGDMEVVILQRVDTNVFSGQLRTSGTSGQTSQDGTLNVPPGTQITLTYNDNIPRVTQKAFIRMAIVGTVRVVPRLIHDSPTLDVTINDIDMNRNSSLREALIVAAINSRNPDQPARVSLIESSPASGRFEGAISLTFSANLQAVNDGTLRGINGDLITISYQDTAPTGTRSDSVNLTFAGTLRLPSSILAGGEVAIITVIDGDLDVDPLVSDTHEGAVTVGAAGEVPATLDITETGTSSGIFTAGILPMIRSFEGWGDLAGQSAAQITVDLGSELQVTYIDTHGDGTVSVMASVHLRGLLQVVVTDTGPSASQGLSITLMDPDLISYAVAIPVYISSSSSAAATVLLEQSGAGSHIFTGAVQSLPLQDAGIVTVQYEDAAPAATVTLRLIAPRPRFVTPTPSGAAVLHTAVGCTLQVLLRAENTADSTTRLPGAHVAIRASRHSVSENRFEDGLPHGAALAPFQASANVSTAFSWKPRPEQEGLRVTVCFLVEVINLGVGTNSEDTERCFQIEVGQCKMCASAGDSLGSLGLAMGSDWRALWSINPNIEDPEVLGDGQLLQTALVYRVSARDSLSALAARFGSSVGALLQRNSLLSLGQSLTVGETICILPAPAPLDACPEPAKSSTWEALEEQYIPPDYLDNPFNWEYIQWTDLQGQPVKISNPDYPQLPAQVVGEEPGYSLGDADSSGDL